jgi:hypothetical protein
MTTTPSFIVRLAFSTIFSRTAPASAYPEGVTELKMSLAAVLPSVQFLVQWPVWSSSLLHWSASAAQ